MKFFKSSQPFTTEGGITLPGLTIAYETFGSLNAAKTNVVWVCHALTSNANPQEWWPGMVGKGAAFDTNDQFVVCANILGSCYGSTGPLTIDPQSGQPWYSRFPLLTIGDMVQAHVLLRKHLGIEHIAVLAGGSMGGYQALEWALLEPLRIGKLFLLSTSATESAWGIAIHTAQRMAIEADESWNSNAPGGGKKGLKAARAMGLVSYRNYEIIVAKQTDSDAEKTDGFKASSYMNHQGNKLAARFHAFTYWLLTKAMDTHNIARGRHKTAGELLATITQPTFVVSVTSDMLCPPEAQRFLARHMPNAKLFELHSWYGHDGFLIETETISAAYKSWLAAVNAAQAASTY